jgi:hypothetical protein
MLNDAERLGDAAGCVNFESVPLAVVEAQRMAGETLGPRDRQRRGGIEPAGEQYDCIGRMVRH